ncbi:uncharacterized protein [Choristoneura fumiferana]|uniref:uncharacterized protein n=1 Tax=Choristoneura fumiferana TaxID=7141 RepID=UPI003D15EAFB
MPLPLSRSRSSSIHLEADVLNDCKIVLRKLDNMTNVVARSNFFMDSKLMMLKLRRARMGAQLAYSRQQSLLAEIELRLAEADLKNELTRRRQLVTRSHARQRHTIKSLTNVASKKKTTKVDKDAIGEKTTVDKSTQVDEIADQTAQSVEKTDKVERRKDIVSKKKRRTDKDALSKEKAKTSSVGADETHSTDKPPTSSKEINENPNKKQKTDVESHCSADKGEKTNRHKKDYRGSREKRKDRRDSKRSSKNSKTENNKKSAAPNNKQELHNDIHKGKDSKTNGKPAKNKHDAEVKKSAKSVHTNPVTKDICKVSTVNNDQVSNVNKSEEYSEPNLSCNIEKTLLAVEVENVKHVCEASEDNSDKHIESTTTDEAVQPSMDNKCCIFSNTCNLDKNDAVSRPDFTVLCNIIQEMCEASEKEVIDNDFKGLRAMKRERSHSISSVETLKL